MDWVLRLRQLLRCRLGAASDGGIDVADDLNWLVSGFFIDGLEAAKDEAERIGDDTGATGRDAALSDDDDEVG